MAVNHLPSGWQLWKTTFVAYRTKFWTYTFIVLVVSLPVAILNALASGDATVTAYGSLASLFMNAALLYFVANAENKPGRVKLRQLYYRSSNWLLRYLIVGVVLAFMLIPAALGLGLMSLSGNTAPAGEVILLSVIALLLALPSIYLLIRNGLAVIIVFAEDFWPGVAFKSSRKLTAGHFWGLLGRYLIMVVGLIVFALPLSVILVGLYIVTKLSLLLAAYQIINAALILPLLYIYLFQIYKCLSHEDKE